MTQACPTPGGNDQDRQEPPPYTSASRRDITLGTAGIVIASHLSPERDTAAGERELAATRIDDLAMRWEHIGPAQASAAALVIVQRLEAGDRQGDTGMLYARALALHAQAEADRGHDERAAQVAATARLVASEASRAAGAARNGQWDAAYSYAAGAVDAAQARDIPAWLVGGVTRLTKQSRGGGDWRALRATVSRDPAGGASSGPSA